MKSHLLFVGLKSWANAVIFRKSFSNLCTLGHCLGLFLQFQCFGFHSELFDQFEINFCAGWQICMSPILFYTWISNIPSMYLCLSKMFSSPVDDSGILVRNHVALFRWTTVLSFYCLAFYFISLIFISASEPTSYCFYYFSSVKCLEI